MTFKKKRKILAQNVLQLRSRLNLTQDEVARRAGVSVRSLQLVESAKGNPTFETLLGLASTFEVTLDRLIHIQQVHLEDSEVDLFFDRYQKQFENYPDCVGLRTTQGVALWVNQATLTRIGHLITWPVDMHAILKKNPTVYQIFCEQLDAERSGVAKPYLMPQCIDDANPGDMYRVFPILIYPKRAKSPTWTGTLSVKAGAENSTTLFNYYSGVLDCLDLLETGETGES